MKKLFKSTVVKTINVVLPLALSMGLSNCSSSDDEPQINGGENPTFQVNENAIVKSIADLSSDGSIYKIYEFDYDENNEVKSWTETETWDGEQKKYIIKKGEGTIAIVKENDENYESVNYGYENGYITTCWGDTMRYESGKLVKGCFCSIAWDGANINNIIRSGRKHEYWYNELLNNASINFNAFLEYNMKAMIDDDFGDEFVSFGLAAGTRTKNLLSEVETGLYDEDEGYLGPHKDIYKYETDSVNRVTKITIINDRREYGGNLYENVYEITYRD